jgi:hypothetical protein
MYTIHVSYLGSGSGFGFFLFLGLLSPTVWCNWVSLYQSLYCWARRSFSGLALRFFFFFFFLILDSLFQTYAEKEIPFSN